MASGSSLRAIYEIVTNKNEGISYLYRGWCSLVMALVCLNFVYFYCFRAFRRCIEQYVVENTGNPDTNSVIEAVSNHKVAIDLVAGYLAGVVGVLLTGPLWLVNTRLKLQGLDLSGKSNASKPQTKIPSSNIDHGILSCICEIASKEGILTLWSGTATSIVLSINPAIQLGLYELLKRNQSVLNVLTQSTHVIQSKVIVPFVNALLAKFMATIITYPIQVLQTRHRAGIKTSSSSKQQSDNIKNRGGWINDLKVITQQHGFRELYRGLESKLLQTLLNSGFMFLIYEHLVEFLRGVFETHEAK
jgi:adenine nucleotide transporter 17